MKKLCNAYKFTKLMSEQSIINKNQLKHNLLLNALNDMAYYIAEHKYYDERIEEEYDTEAHHISYYIATDKMLMRFLSKFIESTANKLMKKVTEIIGHNQIVPSTVIRESGITDKEVIERVVKRLCK